MPAPHLLALFHRNIDGDESLLRLAQRRFEEVGLGAEFYPGTVGELEWAWQFRPRSASAHMAHLPRHWDATMPGCQTAVVEFARAFAGRLRGMTIHDHPDWEANGEAVAEALVNLDAELGAIDQGPTLFVEYAAGVSLESYVQLLADLADCGHLSGCVDIGHVGIFNTRRVFQQRHPQRDLWSLRPDSPELPELLGDLQAAVAASLPAVIEVIESLAAWGKPLHFHLHDGHPLAAVGEFGVRDHLSFDQSIPLPFEYEGRQSLPLLYGPEGLARIVRAALDSPAQGQLSFMLEIHHVSEREPLGEHADLFSHWTDLTNAERMNRWLSVLQQNHRLLEQLVRRA